MRKLITLFVAVCMAVGANAVTVVDYEKYFTDGTYVKAQRTPERKRKDYCLFFASLKETSSLTSLTSLTS